MAQLVEAIRQDDERPTRFWTSAIYIMERKSRHI
jgi:hypothetical protein